MQILNIHIWLRNSRCRDQVLPVIEFLQQHAQKNGLQLHLWGSAKKSTDFTRDFEALGTRMEYQKNGYASFYRFILSNGRKIFISTADSSPTANNVPIGMIKTCRKAGIPSLSIDHGFPAINFACKRHIYNFYSDCRATWGEYMRQKYINELGKQPGEVTVTGNSAYDELLKLPRQEIRQKTRAALGLEDGQKVCLFAGSRIWGIEEIWGVSPGQMQATWTETFRGIRTAAKDIVVLTKPHPSDFIYESRLHPFYERLVKETGIKSRLLHREFSIQALYCAADIVIFQFSSAGIEAAFAGQPSIMARPVEMIPEFELKPDGKVIYDAVTPLNKLADRVSKCSGELLSAPSLTKPDVAQFAGSYGIPVDGNSTEKIGQMVLQMATQSTQDNSTVNYLKRYFVLAEHFIDISKKRFAYS